MNRIRHAVAGLLLLISLAAPCSAMAKGVVLIFNDVDISTMVKFISDLTGKNFIMDDRVKGKISVFSPAKLSTEDAFNVFTSVLELKGFTVVPAGRVYKIVPTSSAKQSGMKIFTDQERGPVNDTYVARVVTLENISSQEAVSFLQPIVSKDGYISSFGPGNMLLLVDSALNTQKILGILKLIDTDQPRQGPELVFLKNAGAESVAEVIRDWIGGKEKTTRVAGLQTQQASPSVGVMVVPDVRLNALIIFGNDKDKADIKQLVNMLDVVPPTTSSKVNVYYLENADATDLAKVLDGVVKGSVAAPGAANPAQGAPLQQSAFEGSKITITPDKATNSLVIMASPTDYQNLVQVIKKLDKRRPQVFVQTIIAEVSLDKLKDLGLQWGVFGAASDGKYASVFGEYDPQGTISTILSVLEGASGTGTTGSSLGSIVNIPNSVTPTNFAAVLQALQSNNVVNILSTPTIMTSDNKEALITVGQNVPLITTSTLVATGASQQSVERKDVGITLKITPQISEGEYVKLDIDQDISAVTPNKGQATDIVLSTRKAKTSVVVKDKDTVVIGGLIQDQDTEVVSKVPVLGDIPLLGWLFKNKHKERTKTNLLIILTPRIVRGSQDMADVTGAQKETFGKAAKSTAPINLEKELNISK